MLTLLLCESNAENPLHTFPSSFHVYGEFANLSATSCCNGIWETTRHNRHNGLLPAPTCYGLVVYIADLLRGNWCNGFWPLLNKCQSTTCIFITLMHIQTSRVDNVNQSVIGVLFTSVLNTKLMNKWSRNIIKTHKNDTTVNNIDWQDVWEEGSRQGKNCNKHWVRTKNKL